MPEQVKKKKTADLTDNPNDEVSVAIYSRKLSKRAPLTHDKEIEAFERLETKINALKEQVIGLGVAAPFFKELLFRVINGGERKETYFNNDNIEEVRTLLNNALTLHSKGNKCYADGNNRGLKKVREELRGIFEAVKLKPYAYTCLGEKLRELRGHATSNPFKQDIYEGQLWMSLEDFSVLCNVVESLLRDVREIKDRIVESNLRLVFSLVKKYCGKNACVADYIQEGNMGLMKAVERFDYSLGYKFSTYATWWIRQGITKAVNEGSHIIQVPTHILTEISNIAKKERLLTQLNGVEPTIEELSNATKVSVERIKELRGYVKKTISYDNPIGDDDATILDFIADHTVKDPSEEASYNMMRSKIGDILEILTPREREVIQRRFGIDDGVVQTLEEIGKRFNISREAVRLIEVKALRKMRGASAVTIGH